jgi:potassium channel subfamily T protein 1
MVKEKQSTSYSRQRVGKERHVVVCATTLQLNAIMDFLNEFYAHRKLQNYCSVLLSPSELDKNLAIILQVPLWSQRVIYIQGSAMNNSDLNRAQVEHAEACFIMAARNYPDRQAADQHTILRSWAIKDYAPHCVQYVHLLKPENKMHVQHASMF